MSELSLHFETAGASGAQLKETVHALRQHLLELPAVEKVAAVPTGGARYTGAKVEAGIAVGVAVLKGGSELIEVLRKVIEAVKKLPEEFSTKARQPNGHAVASQTGREQRESQPAVGDRPMDGEPINVIQITNVVVDVGLRSVPLSDLTEDDLQELVRRLQRK